VARHRGATQWGLQGGTRGDSGATLLGRAPAAQSRHEELFTAGAVIPQGETERTVARIVGLRPEVAKNLSKPGVLLLRRGWPVIWKSDRPKGDFRLARST
jgi:hypothetical protein